MIGFPGAPRYANLVRYLTGDEEIVPPGIVLEQDRPEWLYLGKTTLGGGSFSITSGALTFPAVLILNPNGNSLTVITRLRFTSDLAQTLQLNIVRGLSPAPNSASGPLDTRDPRVIGTGVLATNIQTAVVALALGGVAFDFVRAQVGVMVEDREPIVLAPLTGLVIQGTSAAVNTLTGGARWYERGMRAEELALL